MAYPFVDCPNHRPQPGYVICVHVIDGEEVFYFERATKKIAGLVLCEACEEFEQEAQKKKQPAPIDHLRTCCARCAHPFVVKGLALPVDGSDLN